VVDHRATEVRFRLDGQVALVTGVGPGIGEHIARVFADAGADLVVCDRVAGRAEELAATLAAGGVSCLGLTVDVSDAEQVAELAQRAVERFGRVDVLFNNAYSAQGSAPGVDVLDLAESDWASSVAVNLLAPYRLARALVPGMRSLGGGAIINVLSTAAFRPILNRGYIAYGATKAGLEMMTRYLAKECGPQVRANMICPGTISPDGVMWDLFVPIVGGSALRRVGAADELSAAALLLASPAGSYLTARRSSSTADG
jgi:NAD(P)-dependent dehydrogenase (short-subunit alcohol dehydrogenase family)